MHLRCRIEVDAVMTDNGAEFGAEVIQSRPFERSLLEMDINVYQLNISSTSP